MKHERQSFGHLLVMLLLAKAHERVSYGFKRILSHNTQRRAFRKQVAELHYVYEIHVLDVCDQQVCEAAVRDC